MVMLTFPTLANIIFYLCKNDYLLKEHQAQKSNLLCSGLLLIVPASCQEKPGKERQTKINSTVYFHFCYFPERQSTQRFTVFKRINQPAFLTAYHTVRIGCFHSSSSYKAFI